MDSNCNPLSLYTQMLVSGKAVKFQLDSGAAVNVLALSVLAPGTKVKPSRKSLKTHDDSTLSTKGTAQVNLINPQTQPHHEITFEIVQNSCMPLLGAQVVQELKLLAVNKQNFVHVAAVTTQRVPAIRPDILAGECYADVFASRHCWQSNWHGAPEDRACYFAFMETCLHGYFHLQ